MKLHNIFFCNTSRSSSAFGAGAQLPEDHKVGLRIPGPTLRGSFVSKCRAFTLIEILIVVGIFAVLMSVGMLMGFDSIARSTVHNERDLVVLMLTGARTRALANVNQHAHGVRITSNDIILFEKDSISGVESNQRMTPRNSVISVSPTDAEVVFEQLSGNANVVNIELSDGSNKTAEIEISGQGRIEW